jgi:hypothetical protein
MPMYLTLPSLEIPVTTSGESERIPQLDKLCQCADCVFDGNRGIGPYRDQPCQTLAQRTGDRRYRLSPAYR